jgi:hypothetical protein
MRITATTPEEYRLFSNSYLVERFVSPL